MTGVNPETISRNDFTIAVICALKFESDAVEGIFDTIFPRSMGVGRSNNDPNTYTLGKIDKFNVVLAYLSHKGKAASASTTANLRATFPRIKLVIVVGVCGGVPRSPGRDDMEIILGDVIISTEIHQFDYGRLFDMSIQEKTTVADSLGRAPNELRAFINYLSGNQGSDRLKGDTIRYLKQLLGHPKFLPSRYPGVHADKLFPQNYLHKHRHPNMCLTCSQHESSSVCGRAPEMSCAQLGCDGNLLVPRPRLQLMLDHTDIVSPDLGIFFGPIASGDQVIRSALRRDQIAEEHGVIGFEMEGAGVWDTVSTVVIKGVSDYADSHKDRAWQGYAAATAAACMKGFLRQYEPTDLVDCPGTNQPAMEKFFRKRSLLIQLLIFLVYSIGLVMVIDPRQHPVPDPPIITKEPGIDPRRPIFGILGKTGVGESTFIDLLGGRNLTGHPPQICHGLETCTSDLEYYEAEVDNTPIYLIDTPGFDDKKLSDEQIMTLIVENLQKDKLLKGLIYLHDITEPRFGRLAENHIYLFEKLCGVQAFENIMLVTTKWMKTPWADPEGNERQHSREEQLRNTYWKEMIQQGSTMSYHDGTAGSARRIVTWLLHTSKVMRLIPRNRSHSTDSPDPKALVDTKERKPDPGALETSWSWRRKVFHCLMLLLTAYHALSGVWYFGSGMMQGRPNSASDLLVGGSILLASIAIYLWTVYHLISRYYCSITCAFLMLLPDIMRALVSKDDRKEFWWLTLVEELAVIVVWSYW